MTDPRAQRAQLALGLASFALLLALLWVTLTRTTVPSEGRHELRHTIIVNEESVEVLTRSLAGEDLRVFMLRHKDLLDKARKGD